MVENNKGKNHYSTRLNDKDYIDQIENWLAQRLRSARISSGFSQEHIANKLNVSHKSRVATLEGHKAKLQVATLCRWAKALGFSSLQDVLRGCPPLSSRTKQSDETFYTFTEDEIKGLLKEAGATAAKATKILKEVRAKQ